MQTNIEKIAKGAGDAFFGWQTSYGYMTQIWVWHFRFHIFLRDDPGEALHNHPWQFWTFPLRSYVEDVLDYESNLIHRQIVHRFWIHHRSASYSHRIAGAWDGTITAGIPGVCNKRIPTIAFRGHAEGAWHYIRVQAGKINRFPWRRYLEHIEKRPAKTEE